MRRISRKLVLLTGACAVALVVVGASSGAHKAAKSGAAGKTLVFGTSADPVVLDGALVSDGESLRVIDQITESLITLVPGTTKIKPGLALSWKNTGGGKVWTFALRHGVKFHDGTPFNAAAVCYNFNRWYNFKGAFQSPDATYYWQAILLGFHHNESSDLSPSLYKSCKAKGQYSVQFRLAKPFGPFIPALSLTNFGIASPKALKKYGANKAEIKNGVFTPTGKYGFEHPTGTGPFKFKSWTIGEKLEIVRKTTTGVRRPSWPSHLPAHQQQHRPTSGAPDGRDHGLRPRCPAGLQRDQEQLRPEATEAPGVQRRVRDAAPGPRLADERPQGQAGSGLRPEPRGPDQLGGVPARRRGGEGVPAAPAVRMVAEGQDLLVQPEQGRSSC